MFAFGMSATLLEICQNSDHPFVVADDFPGILRNL